MRGPLARSAEEDWRRMERRFRRMRKAPWYLRAANWLACHVQRRRDFLLDLEMSERYLEHRNQELDRIFDAVRPAAARAARGAPR